MTRSLRPSAAWPFLGESLTGPSLRCPRAARRAVRAAGRKAELRTPTPGNPGSLLSDGAVDCFAEQVCVAGVTSGFLHKVQ